MKKIFGCFCILFLFGSCGSSEKSSLQADETITAVFSDEEIDDLQQILDFFTEKICASQKSDQSDPANCFSIYLSEQKALTPNGIRTIPVLYQDQLDLFQQLKSNVDDEIWNPSLDDNLASAGINIQGKYIDFLKLVGGENSAIMNYHDNILNAGGIGAANQASVAATPELYDVTDIRIRLVLSIHFLTLNAEDNVYGG